MEITKAILAGEPIKVFNHKVFPLVAIRSG